jgi:hypothetical protein
MPFRKLGRSEMKRDRRLPACTGHCGLAFLLVAAMQLWRTESATFAQATAKVNTAIEIPMELLFSRPLVRGTVNGEGPMVILIDPQLQTTLIAPALADRLNLKQAGNTRGTAQTLIELGFGVLRFPKVPVEVRGTAQFVPELRPASRPAVVLALSMWGDQLVTLDFGRFQVRVEPGALPEPNGRDVYALTPRSNELRVNLTIGGRAIEGRIDLLFPGGVLLPESYLTQLPLASKPTEAAPVSAREGAVKVREGRLTESVRLADVEVTSPLVLFGDVDRATVGYGALTRLSITYDMAQGRARLNRKQ